METKVGLYFKLREAGRTYIVIKITNSSIFYTDLENTDVWRKSKKTFNEMMKLSTTPPQLLSNDTIEFAKNYRENNHKSYFDNAVKAFRMAHNVLWLCLVADKIRPKL